MSKCVSVHAIAAFGSAEVCKAFSILASHPYLAALYPPSACFLQIGAQDTLCRTWIRDYALWLWLGPFVGFSPPSAPVRNLVPLFVCSGKRILFVLSLRIPCDPKCNSCFQKHFTTLSSCELGQQGLGRSYVVPSLKAEFFLETLIWILGPSPHSQVS